MRAAIIPPSFEEKIRSWEEAGYDYRQIVVEALRHFLKVKPSEASRAHVFVAEDLLEEGKMLIDKAPLLAAEKLYRASEEMVKALAEGFELKIINIVAKKGKWELVDLEEALSELSKRYGNELKELWEYAWKLHEGFLEGKITKEEVLDMLPKIIEFYERAKELLG